MLFGILVLLICQLLGELIVTATALPVPGPVMGMLLLLLILIGRGVAPASLRTWADGLLKHLALLYVPAGVGLMLHLAAISQYWLAIIMALFISTLLTLVVTVLALRWLAARQVRK